MHTAEVARLTPRRARRLTAAPVGVPTIRAVDWRTMEAESECFGWDALALHASEPNPFVESWYLLPALRALDPMGQVKLLRLEIGGRLAGLMPLAPSWRYYGWPLPHLAAWSHPNCFLGQPLVASGDEAAFWRALFDWADSQAGAGLFLHLGDLPLAGPLYAALRDVLDADRRRFAIVHREHRPLLQAGQSSEALLAANLTAKERSELRRKQARLAEQGSLAFEHERGSSGLDAWTDCFLRLEAAGWKGAAGSALASTPASADLFRAALQGGAAAGRLERRTLRLDGQPIAMMASFLTPPGAYGFKTAYDERFARFSPGMLLQCANLEVLDRGEIAWFDSCAREGGSVIDRLWRDRREIGKLSIAIGGPLRRALFAGLLGAELRGSREDAPA